MTTTAEAIPILVDGLALAYHEARHVRVLTKAGHLSLDDWAPFIDLPRDRIEAWRTILARRQAAALETDAKTAATIFATEYGRPAADLAVLFSNPHWIEAAVGGQSWRQVIARVLTLRDTLAAGDPAQFEPACARLVNFKLDDGRLRDRIAGLDRAIGFATHPLWQKIWMES
jgi:hypothetical protein